MYFEYQLKCDQCGELLGYSFHRGMIVNCKGCNEAEKFRREEGRLSRTNRNHVGLSYRGTHTKQRSTRDNGLERRRKRDAGKA